VKTLIDLIKSSWDAFVEKNVTTPAGERAVRDIALVR
jgi:hypothetical protein